MYDYLLLGGWVVDGTGNPARRADVAFRETGLPPWAAWERPRQNE